MADKKVINKIMSEYENLRITAATERKKRIDNINSKFPRIGEIDKEIFMLGSKNMRDILKNPEKSDELNKKLRENLNRLKAEKNKIISENNIDPDYDKYKYKCSVCSDTGYKENGERCVCFKQRLINEAYAVSNMSELIKEQNFENFSLEYYSADKDTTGFSPRENAEKILSGCKSFCKNFEADTKSLLFSGPTGLGKTFLSSAIAKEIMDSGKTVVYVRATRLFTIYEDYRFGRNTDRSDIENIYNADLLIIDDLGTEPNSTNNISFLFDVVNERISSGRKMIINTNFSLSELKKMYSTRFTSRVFEYFMMYQFVGEDIRIQKMKKEMS